MAKQINENNSLLSDAFPKVHKNIHHEYDCFCELFWVNENNYDEAFRNGDYLNRELDCCCDFCEYIMDMLFRDGIYINHDFGCCCNLCEYAFKIEKTRKDKLLNDDCLLDTSKKRKAESCETVSNAKRQKTCHDMPNTATPKPYASMKSMDDEKWTSKKRKPEYCEIDSNEKRQKTCHNLPSPAPQLMDGEMLEKTEDIAMDM